MPATEAAFRDITVASAQPTKQQPYKKYCLIEYTLTENPTREWEAHFRRDFAATQQIESIKGRCVLMKFPGELVEEDFLATIKEQIVGATRAANAACRNDGEMQRLAEEARLAAAARDAQRLDRIADILQKQFPLT